MGDIRVGGGEHGLDVLADLLGLLGDGGADEVALLVNGDLTGQVKGVAGFHSMGLHDFAYETLMRRVRDVRKYVGSPSKSN